MRRVVVPAIALTFTLLSAACGTTADEQARPRATTRPTEKASVPAPRQADRALILASYEGAVSVRATTGKVEFRAPYGMPAPDSSTIVQAQPITTGTRVVASDPLTGVPRWSHDVSGARRVRVVSPGGTFVALVNAGLVNASAPRESTEFVIATAKGTRELRLAGNLDPEAFSVNGRYLYVLDFLPAMMPNRYSVRRVDLQTQRIEPVPDRDGGVRDPMPGYASTQVISPDGRQLYTFYASPEPVHDDDGTYNAWVHVLNLAEGWAHCVDLDEKIGVQGALAGLAVTPDGSRVYVTDSVSHAIAAIDATTLAVVRTRFPTQLANPHDVALVGTDGHTVFVRDAGGGLATFDAQTLATETGTISGVAYINALRVDRAGEALYLLTQDGLLVVDRRGRIVHRWADPGGASSIDPAVTRPGRGAYQCAC